LIKNKHFPTVVLTTSGSMGIFSAKSTPNVLMIS